MNKLRSYMTLLIALATIGCGESNPLGRKAISGDVIFDGEPLETGLIEFAPVDPNGVSTGGPIENGGYAIAAHQGIPPGQYKVRITSPTDRVEEEEPSEPSPPGPAVGGPRQPPPARERIPPDYNTKTKQTVEVTEAGPNQFNFKIPRGKSR